MTTVGIVEDDQSVRIQRARLLDAAPGFQCIGSWPCGEEALPALIANQPGISGIECVAALKEKAPAVNLLMLTAYEDSEKVFQALGADAGARVTHPAKPQRINSRHQTSPRIIQLGASSAPPRPARPRLLRRGRDVA